MFAGSGQKELDPGLTWPFYTKTYYNFLKLGPFVTSFVC